MAKFKVHKESNFTVVDNGFIANPKISLKAKGLLLYMLSLPDDWDYSEKGLASKCKEGRDAIRNILEELEKFGYLIRGERERDDQGYFKNAVWDIYEIAKQDKKPGQHPRSENPTLDNPTLDNPTLDNATLENPTLDYPTLENNTELNTNILRTKEQNTSTNKQKKSVCDKNENKGQDQGQDLPIREKQQGQKHNQGENSGLEQGQKTGNMVCDQGQGQDQDQVQGQGRPVGEKAEGQDQGQGQNIGPLATDIDAARGKGQEQPVGENVENQDQEQGGGVTLEELFDDLCSLYQRKVKVLDGIAQQTAAFNAFKAFMENHPHGLNYEDLVKAVGRREDADWNKEERYRVNFVTWLNEERYVTDLQGLKKYAFLKSGHTPRQKKPTLFANCPICGTASEVVMLNGIPTENYECKKHGAFKAFSVA